MKRIKKLLSKLPSEAVYDTMTSPVGLLLIFVSNKGIHSILWEHEVDRNECKSMLKRYRQCSKQEIIVKTKQQLKEYFAGKRKAFDIPLCLDGTPFQIKAWQELYKIPYGQTISYGEQAARLGNKNKARAVGLANGLNPISIIMPCHRVIGSSGHLTGFGGGLKNKKFLLQLEKDACHV
ncbi:MAG: methylated-DNA--[protein]-cysteine S-methyltransferase [Pseudomonadota bacterium]